MSRSQALSGLSNYYEDYALGDVGAGDRILAKDNGVRRSSGYGHHSGHGGGYGHKYVECCELVVDPLTFFSLLGAIIGGTAFLNTVITMDTMLPQKRRRRKRDTEGRVAADRLGLGDKLADMLNSGRMAKNRGTGVVFQNKFL